MDISWIFFETEARGRIVIVASRHSVAAMSKIGVSASKASTVARMSILPILLVHVVLRAMVSSAVSLVCTAKIVVVLEASRVVTIDLVRVVYVHKRHVCPVFEEKTFRTLVLAAFSQFYAASSVIDVRAFVRMAVSLVSQGDLRVPERTVVVRLARRLVNTTCWLVPFMARLIPASYAGCIISQNAARFLRTIEVAT
jgi:hypothetical protein